MTTDVYAAPRKVTDQRNCYFYHTMDLPGVGTIEGPWDLRGRFSEYTGGVEFSGKRVLDVGAATGFLTFEMERCGADVVSFDLESAHNIERLGYPRSLYSTDRAQWIREVDPLIERGKNGYWFCHNIYGSHARVLYGDVYALPVSVGMFDIVMIGQILVHLKDPVSALTELTRVASDMIVVTEGMLDTSDPIMGLCANPVTGPDWSWWHLSTGLYENLFTILGFKVLRHSRHVYQCRDIVGPTTLTTLVARRDPQSSSGAGFGAV